MIESLKPYMMCLPLVVFLFAAKAADANTMQQMQEVEGRIEVRDEQQDTPLAMATVIVNDRGYLTGADGRTTVRISDSNARLQISYVGYAMLDTTLSAAALAGERVFYLRPLVLNAATVEEKGSSLSHVPTAAIEDFTVFSAKKADIVRPQDLSVNPATNSARQLFAKVAGLTIWENGDGGSQLNIGTRGLNPSRTSNFNTRQNGYDISADPLGYPETYYTPPMQAVKRIELIRGAASLQFGPQFGGMLNFALLDAPDRKFGFITEQTAGSFGMISSFNAVGGKVGKVEYFAYWQHRKSDGWRERSAFATDNAHVRIKTQLSPRARLAIEYTRYTHLAQTPGGLTDVLFERDPETVLRDRNWFGVTWNLIAAIYEHDLSTHTKLQIRPFALSAERNALGFIGRISRIDPGGQRDLIKGEFDNWGVESRIVHNWEFRGLPATLVGGVRYFDGNTRNRQNAASDADTPDFSFVASDAVNGSDYRFDNSNVSVFAEQVFRLSSKLTVTPGIRYEYIRTASEGSYTQVVTDAAGNVLPTYPRNFSESSARARQIVLGGLGVSYKIGRGAELYGNLSTNYRGINFSDIRIANPNQVVDPDIHDERGHTFDAGIRGTFSDWLFVDASVFRLVYRDKIGTRLDTATFNPAIGPQIVQKRANLADAFTQGIEFSTEVDVVRIFNDKSDFNARIFANVAWLQSEYTNENDAAINGNMIEYVPEWNTKGGVQLNWKGLSASWQIMYVSEQFSDATNAPAGSDPNAVVGSIPSYSIQDMSLGYNWKGFSLRAGVDNLLDARYFTRRATGYPGPGILPANPRNFYVTLRVQRW
jgi:Fe(3+) dicitrate transport protein